MVVTTAVYSEIEVRNRPSFYATPVAWAVASFTQRLIEANPTEPHRTGLLVVSDECSLATIRELSRTAALGTVSPLRFAGASPSILAGLPALQQGIRGPTLCLTMRPQHAVDALAATISFWIRYTDIASAIVVAHYPQGDDRHVLTGLIAKSAGTPLRQQLLRLCRHSDGDDAQFEEHQCVEKTISSPS